MRELLRKRISGNIRWQYAIFKAYWHSAVRAARIPGDLELIIVSPGGVGTTFLIRHLSKFRKTNCPYDSDGLKHRVVPPKKLGELDVRVIFVDGQNEDIYYSLKRRCWLEMQSAKLGVLKVNFTRDPEEKTYIFRSCASAA